MSKSKWDYKVDADEEIRPMGMSWEVDAYKKSVDDYRKKLAGGKLSELTGGLEVPKALEVAKKSTEAATKTAMDTANTIQNTVSDGIKTGSDAVRNGLGAVGSTIGSTVGGAMESAKSMAGGAMGMLSELTGIGGDGAGGGGGESGTKPGIKATKNVFVCDGNDSLQVVDPYDASGDSPINKVKEAGSSLASNIKSGLKTAREYIKLGKSYVAKGRSIYKKGQEYKKAFDAINNGKGSMVNRILGNNKLVKGVLTDIGYGDLANNSAMKFLESKAPTLVKYDNLVTKVKSTDFNNQRQVANLLNTYSKDGALFKFEDMGSNLALGARVIQDATKYGFPNSFATVVKTLEGGQAIQELAQATLPSGIIYSDFKLIEDIHGVVGDGSVLLNRPGIAKEFAAAYNRPWDAPSAKDSTNYNNVVSMYKKVDPDWNLSYRDMIAGNEPVIDLDRYLEATDQFKEVLETGSRLLPTDAPFHDRAMAAIRQVRSTTVRDEIRKHFPSVIINRAMQGTRLAVDPILLA